MRPIVCHESFRLIKRRNVIALLAMLLLPSPGFSLKEVESYLMEFYIFINSSRGGWQLIKTEKKNYFEIFYLWSRKYS